MGPVVLKMIDGVIVSEGGDKYTNHPKDKGGPTRWGITEATARAYGYVGLMTELPREVAVAIYYERFWLAPKFDEVAKIVSLELAAEMMDWGVTSSPSRPMKALQRALNVLNREGKDYPDIEADGGFGRITRHALTSYIAVRGDPGKRVLVGMVRSQRSVFYMEVAERNASQEVFENGWQGRLFAGDK